jgi:hypothetical protein
VYVRLMGSGILILSIMMLVSRVLEQHISRNFIKDGHVYWYCPVQ